MTKSAEEKVFLSLSDTQIHTDTQTDHNINTDTNSTFTKMLIYTRINTCFV